MKYRKTALIEASQWWKMGDHPAVVMASDVTGATAEHPLPFCPTLEGGHIVTPGDWIATGIQGEHWPIKPDVFAATYEPAGEGAASRHADGPSFMSDRTWPDCLDPNASHNRRTRGEEQVFDGWTRDEYNGMVGAENRYGKPDTPEEDRAAEEALAERLKCPPFASPLTQLEQAPPPLYRSRDS